jgi:hypothetical protein
MTYSHIITEEGRVKLQTHQRPHTRPEPMRKQSNQVSSEHSDDDATPTFRQTDREISTVSAHAKSPEDLANRSCSPHNQPHGVRSSIFTTKAS